MVNSHHIALFFIIFDVFFLLCDTDSKQAGWNQSATNSCKKGTNIPFNQDTWHRNDCIKQGIKSLGPSVTENAVQRLSHTKSPLAYILGHLDASIKSLFQSGKHGNASLGEDLDELIKRALKFNNFTSLGGILLPSGSTISPLQLEKAGRLLIHFVKMFAAYYV